MKLPRYRFVPQPLLSLALLLVWLLAFDAVSVGLLLLGTTVSVLIPLATHPFWPDYPPVSRYGELFRLLWVFLFDVVIANLHVARLILGRRERLRPAFIVIPLDIEHPMQITLLASMITLTPGTVSSNLSGDGRKLLVHVLDTDDPDGLVRTIKDRYETPLKECFDV